MIVFKKAENDKFYLDGFDVFISGSGDCRSDDPQNEIGQFTLGVPCRALESSSANCFNFGLGRRPLLVYLKPSICCAIEWKLSTLYDPGSLPSAEPQSHSSHCRAGNVYLV